MILVASLWLFMLFAIRIAILIARWLSYCRLKAANHLFNLLPSFSSQPFTISPQAVPSYFCDQHIQSISRRRSFENVPLEYSLFHRPTLPLGFSLNHCSKYLLSRAKLSSIRTKANALQEPFPRKRNFLLET